MNFSEDDCNRMDKARDEQKDREIQAAQVCPHGQLARSCERCEDGETIRGLKARLAGLDEQRGRLARYVRALEAWDAADKLGEFSESVTTELDAARASLVPSDYAL